MLVVYPFSWILQSYKKIRYMQIFKAKKHKSLLHYNKIDNKKLS